MSRSCKWIALFSNHGSSLSCLKSAQIPGYSYCPKSSVLSSECWPQSRIRIISTLSKRPLTSSQMPSNTPLHVLSRWNSRLSCVVPFQILPHDNEFRRQRGQKITGVQNFSTSFHALERHRASSFISGLPETGTKRRHTKNNAYYSDSSFEGQGNSKRNNNGLNRVSNIRINILSQNKNIKEKFTTHGSKGAKAVKKLRKKIVSRKENIKTIPNLLTTLRMASAPVIAGLVVNDYFGCALSMFVLAGFTDMLDGYIARNFKNQRTALGTALDPLADKLLMFCLTLSLTSAGLIPVPMTVLIVSRDAGLILASFVVRYVSLSPPRTLSRYFDVTHVTAKLFPSTISKINTGLQLSYVAAVLASPVFGFVDHPLLQVLMYTTATTTFLSGLDYVVTWRRRLKIVKND